jgi:hypothetical protein
MGRLTGHREPPQIPEVTQPFLPDAVNRYIALKRKELTGLGHDSSDILEVYYHLTDDRSQAAMSALAGRTLRVEVKPRPPGFESNLRGIGQSRIGKPIQDEAELYVTNLLTSETKRPGRSRPCDRDRTKLSALGESQSNLPACMEPAKGWGLIRERRNYNVHEEWPAAAPDMLLSL